MPCVFHEWWLSFSISIAWVASVLCTFLLLVCPEKKNTNHWLQYIYTLLSKKCEWFKKSILQGKVQDEYGISLINVISLWAELR